MLCAPQCEIPCCKVEASRLFHSSWYTIPPILRWIRERAVVASQPEKSVRRRRTREEATRRLMKKPIVNKLLGTRCAFHRLGKVWPKCPDLAFGLMGLSQDTYGSVSSDEE